MSLQKTRFNLFLTSLAQLLLYNFLGPWKKISLILISLLLGYYFGSNITGYLLVDLKYKPLLVLLVTLFIELPIRLRLRISKSPVPLLWISIDNLRIGAVYALVLEGFKLGS